LPPKRRNLVARSCSFSHANSCLGVGRIVGVIVSILYEIEASDPFTLRGVVHLALIVVSVFGEHQLGNGGVVVDQSVFAGAVRPVLLSIAQRSREILRGTRRSWDQPIVKD
jgi:hypothetical protein